MVWAGRVRSLSPSAFAFGFGAIASKRSEDGEERAVIPRLRERERVARQRRVRGMGG